MTHEQAKAALARAANQDERVEAVRTALHLGMPLHQIEQYLDALDLLLQTGYFSPAPQRER